MRSKRCVLKQSTRALQQKLKLLIILCGYVTLLLIPRDQAFSPLLLTNRLCCPFTIKYSPHNVDIPAIIFFCFTLPADDRARDCQHEGHLSHTSKNLIAFSFYRPSFSTKSFLKEKPCNFRSRHSWINEKKRTLQLLLFNEQDFETSS